MPISDREPRCLRRQPPEAARLITLTYLARDVTSLVGSEKRQSSAKISGVRSPLTK
jgi:hypothetical protein